MKKLLFSAAAVSAALLFVTGTASADIGQRHTFVLGAERLGGVQYYRNKVGNNKVTGVNMSVLYSSTGGGQVIPSVVPRVGADFFVIDALSLGGSIGYYGTSAEVTRDGNNVSADLGTVGGFAFAPRVGWLVDLPKDWSMWLRGGPALFIGQLGNDQDLWHFQLDVEVLFNFLMTESFGLSIGPAMAIPITGNLEKGNRDFDATSLSIGGVAGFFGAF